MKLFQTGPARYRPAPHDAAAYARINQRNMAFVVGLVALSLPTLLWLGVQLDGSCLRDSISHFYYAPFWSGPFVGALLFIGAYLCVYEGEDRGGAEARLATYAGLAAFAVALLPTSGHGCDAESFRAHLTVDLERNPLTGSLSLQPRDLAEAMFALFPYADVVHYAAATLLFGFLAWFSLVVFTATEPCQRDARGRWTRAKRRRNLLYYGCGAVILASMTAIAGIVTLGALTDWDLGWWDAGNWTFWAEAASLWAFGLSWMVKGRFLGFALCDHPEP